MKLFSLIIVTSLILVTSCDIDPPYVSYTNVPVEITSLSVPESGTVDQPVLIMAVAKAPDGCWRQLRFVFTKKENFRYDFYAVGSYESFGVCPQIEVQNDTILSFKPDATGEYVITTLVQPPATIRRDTITVTGTGK